MRRLLLAAALVAAATPACAAAPKPIDPDPMTVSGRFDLPRADGTPLAHRLKLGAVTVDPALAQAAKLDAEALKAAVAQAAARSLGNFGYLAPDNGEEAVTVDLVLGPANLDRQPDGTLTRVQARFSAPAADAACLDRAAEGRFKVLPRARSGGGRRAFAFASTLALGLATGGTAVGTFLPAEFETASAQNRALNSARKVTAGEGVAPGFDETSEIRYGVTGAVQLALADYIGELAASPACRAPEK